MVLKYIIIIYLYMKHFVVYTIYTNLGLDVKLTIIVFIFKERKIGLYISDSATLYLESYNSVCVCLFGFVLLVNNGMHIKWFSPLLYHFMYWYSFLHVCFISSTN